MLWELGTNSVQLRERKNGFLVPKRHWMKHLDFLSFLLESSNQPEVRRVLSAIMYFIASSLPSGLLTLERSTSSANGIRPWVNAPRFPA
jgi:hypothetical protein